MDLEKVFPRGVLRPELFIGVVASVSARSVGVNLSEAGRVSGSHFSGARYGRGEVGEFVLIEGQQGLLLGRIAEVKLRESERRSLTRDFAGNAELDALGSIQLLGSVAMDSLRITAGVDVYPRLGDRIYAAPHQLIAMLPRLMESADTEASPVVLSLGTIDAVHESRVAVKPEKLFGRHCAILGATGGGKSWTTAKIIEECLKFNSKLILIDATGEYRNFSGKHVVHCHLGDPLKKAQNSIASSLPPTSFMESDFIALEALAVQGEATGQVLTQYGSCPLAKARGFRGTDPIPHGNDGVEVVVLEPASYLPHALLANYREILGSCRLLKLPLLVNVLEVQADVVTGSAEQLGHLRLRQPHGLSLQPHLDRTVFSFEDDELPSFVHKSRSLRKAWASEIRSVPEIRPCGSCASSREARTACTTLRIASCRASGGNPGFRRATASSNRLRSSTSSWLSRSSRWPSGPMSSSRSMLYPSARS